MIRLISLNDKLVRMANSRKQFTAMDSTVVAKYNQLSTCLDFPVESADWIIKVKLAGFIIIQELVCPRNATLWKPARDPLWVWVARPATQRLVLMLFDGLLRCHQTGENPYETKRIAEKVWRW